MLNNFETTVSSNSDQLSRARRQRSQGDESAVVEYQVRLTEKRAPAEVLGDLQQLLDSRGLKGRYLIEDGWRSSGALVSIFVNSSRVVDMLEQQGEMFREVSHIAPSASTVCRHAAKVKHFVCNQSWEIVHELMNIRLRFDSRKLKEVLAQINHMSGSGRDQRLAIVEEANAARKEAIKSIQGALSEEGLERKFAVPHAEWDGTHNALTIVGTATVRTRLELKPNVTVERPLRTARGW